MNKQKTEVGRPTTYTEELGDLICEGISQGKSLVKICNENEVLPTPRAVYKWLRIYPEFVQNYTRAKEDQADHLVEEALEIADDPEIESSDKRIRVDTRKWVASRFNAKKYSDKQYIETKDTTEDVSDKDLDERIKALTGKGK